MVAMRGCKAVEIFFELRRADVSHCFWLLPLVSAGHHARRGYNTRTVRGPRRCRQRPQGRLGRIRRDEANLPHRRRRRKYVVHQRCLSYRLEARLRRCDSQSGHRLRQRGRKSTSQGMSDDSPDARSRLCLRRCGVARRWFDLAPVSTHGGRNHAGAEAGSEIGPERAGTDPHRAPRRPFHHARRKTRRDAHYHGTHQRHAARPGIRWSGRLLARRQCA